MSSQCPKNLVSPVWHSSRHLLSPVPLNALPAGKKTETIIATTHLPIIHSLCSFLVHRSVPHTAPIPVPSLLTSFCPPNVPMPEQQWRVGSAKNICHEQELLPRAKEQGLQAQHQPLCLSLRNPSILCTYEVIYTDSTAWTCLQLQGSR